MNKAAIEYYGKTWTKPIERKIEDRNTIKCSCGESFTWKPEDDEPLSDFFKPSRCPKCEAEFQKMQEERDRQREIERAAEEAAAIARLRESTLARLDRMTPARYLATDIKHSSFNLKLWQQVKTWRPTPEIPWLGLIGESGGCKTRFAYLLLRDIVLESLPTSTAMKGARGISFETACAYEIADAIRRQHSRDDTKGAATSRDFLDRLSNTDLLLLDDLGKAKNTQAVVAELFAIIDFRHAENLPTIWTANSPPEVIAAGMSEDIAGPFAGRLIECSNIVTV